MFDLVIHNARICDDSGQPSFLGSLGVKNGRITHLGRHGGLAAPRSMDADGLVLAPGFIDPHTHYDAQVAWDPLLTSSPWHGVTTVVTGNCGVGVAPVRPETRDILMYDLVNVEAIPSTSCRPVLIGNGRATGNISTPSTGVDWALTSRRW
jgi:N-acyl-D-amino-acid deacylase